MSNIAFIGLGNMGAPMARHLMHAGRKLSVYARRTEVMQPFAMEGARAASSPSDCARGADVIFTNVTMTADVE
jgi:3-hydroxyisobutyrate dehydrogenase-like beta-hydroxyacid dehydrogenase